MHDTTNAPRLAFTSESAGLLRACVLSGILLLVFTTSGVSGSGLQTSRCTPHHRPWSCSTGTCCRGRCNAGRRIRRPAAHLGEYPGGTPPGSRYIEGTSKNNPKMQIKRGVPSQARGFYLKNDIASAHCRYRLYHQELWQDLLFLGCVGMGMLDESRYQPSAGQANALHVACVVKGNHLMRRSARLFPSSLCDCRQP